MEMKDSGIKWIGEIPAEWEVVKIKYLADSSLQDSFIDGDWIESPFITSSGIRYLTTGNIGDGKFKRQGNGYITTQTFQELNCKYAYPEDLVFSRLNAPYGRSCILPNDEPQYVLAVDNVILRTKHDKRFICFLTQCRGYQDKVEDCAKGTTMKRISRTNLGNIELPLPPLPTQRRISAFLDEKCSAIDSTIALQEKIIDELKAYKQSIITETVTKGLNPNAKMKDSGIQWIGQVPENWEVCRMKFHVIIGNGSDPKTEGNIPVYGSGQASFKTCGEYKEGPTVLIGRKGSLHIPHYIEGRYWNVDTAFDVHCKEDYCLRFYYYVATSLDYKFYMSQTTLPGMSQSNYNNMPIPVPPLSEQRAIASYLDEKCSDLDELISVRQKKIDALKEYKKSLIYEYVTGKKS